MAWYLWREGKGPCQDLLPRECHPPSPMSCSLVHLPNSRFRTFFAPLPTYTSSPRVSPGPPGWHPPASLPRQCRIRLACASRGWAWPALDLQPACQALVSAATKHLLVSLLRLVPPPPRQCGTCRMPPMPMQAPCPAQFARLETNLITGRPCHDVLCRALLCLLFPVSRSLCSVVSCFLCGSVPMRRPP